MWPLLDLLTINISAICAFALRHYFGDLIIKQPPLLYWDKYLLVLLALNLIYPAIFWVLGLYDRRQKRALLEEFLQIFGVISTSIAVIIIFLFMGRLWWMSRIVIFAFWGLSVVLLSLVRLLAGKLRSRPISHVADVTELIDGLRVRAAGLKKPGLISLVIVAHNSLADLSKCLKSIYACPDGPAWQVIVVDNASTDKCFELIHQQYPQVEYLLNEENRGYSVAVNRGLAAAKGEYVLILNPDIEVLPGAINIMADYLGRHKKVGLIGCRLLNSDGSLQYSARRFLDLRTYLYRFTPLRGLLAGSVIERTYLMQDWDHQNNRLVDWVLGGCMMVRKQAVAEVGLMDERYFLYFEDVDWCFRMWEKGWQVAYVAEAAMFHKHLRTSANKLFNRATKEHFKSLFKFIRQHGFYFPPNCPSSQI